MALLETLPLVGVGAALVVASRFLYRHGAGRRAGPGRRWLRRLLLAVGVILLAMGLGYMTLFNYLAWREAVSPSTARALVLADGHSIPLAEPEPSRSGTSAGPAPSEPVTVLPPSRIKIARLGVDSPVMLSDVDYQLRLPAVGWMIGTALPGELGNIVLYGQRTGPYATFTRLDELQPGDDVVIATEEGEYAYRVRGIQEVSEEDVGVMAPTTTATATLITDSRTCKTQRLVVTAEYHAP